jgi:hypothetical protein
VESIRDAVLVKVDPLGLHGAALFGRVVAGVSYGTPQSTVLLLAAGAALELEGGHCGTALMGACEVGNLDTVKVL